MFNDFRFNKNDDLQVIPFSIQEKEAENEKRERKEAVCEMKCSRISSGKVTREHFWIETREISALVSKSCIGRGIRRDRITHTWLPVTDWKLRENRAKLSFSVARAHGSSCSWFAALGSCARTEKKNRKEGKWVCTKKFGRVGHQDVMRFSSNRWSFNHCVYFWKFSGMFFAYFNFRIFLFLPTDFVLEKLVLKEN